MAKKQKTPQPAKAAPTVAPPGATAQGVGASSARVPSVQIDDPRRGRVYPIGYVFAEVVAEKIRARGNDGKGRRNIWRRGELGVFAPSEVDSLPGCFAVRKVMP